CKFFLSDSSYFSGLPLSRPTLSLTPALFTSTSSRPDFCSVSFTAFAQLAASHKSAPICSQRAPALFSSVHSFAAAVSSRSTIATIAPSFAAPRAIAAPIPFAPPVTKTTLFLSCKSMSAHRQIVEANRISAEYLFFHGSNFARHIPFDDLYYPPVIRRKQTNRPIRSEHQAICPKRLKCNVQILFK